MSVKQNLHIHTKYGDGKDTPEEMVKEAIKRGFESIGFSEHSYMDFSDYPYQMKPEDTPKYKAEITALKEKYKGQIEIFCGIEQEFFSTDSYEGFDYLIGSVHYLDCGGKILGFDRGLSETEEYIKNNFGGDGFAFAKQYFNTVCRLTEKGPFQIIGHFDLLTKNNEKGKFLDTESREYLNLGYEAISALKGKIPFFEVNTGAISRGYRTAPYPQFEFIKEFKNQGFGALITSDCHDKNYIDCFYPEAKEMLLAAGFETIWVLTDNGFSEEKI